MISGAPFFSLNASHAGERGRLNDLTNDPPPTM
jgi:hypothetical protein